MKKKYLINEEEYFGIDSIQEFISLFGKYENANNVTFALLQIAKNVKEPEDVKLVEEVITKHIIYNNNAGLYKQNGKTYTVKKILTYKIPKDLEKVILQKAKEFDKNSNSKAKMNEFVEQSFDK